MHSGHGERKFFLFDVVSCSLEPIVLIMINSYQRLHPGAKLDNYQTPKDLMRMVAHAIDGRYNDEKACLKTVRQYWKNATAALDRDGEKVKPEIINSTTNVSSLVYYSF